MILHNFEFEVLKISFDDLSESNEYRYSQSEGIGANRVFYQFLGVGAQELELKGVLMPSLTSGISKIEKLKKLAGKGRAYVLSDGEGQKWGRFFIKSVNVSQSLFLNNARAQKIEFNLKLTKF